MGFLFSTRLRIAKSVSNIGRPRATKDTTIVNAVYAFVAPSIDITDRTKPKKYAPVEPIKIFAGLKLYGRNPLSAPHSAAYKTANTTGVSSGLIMTTTKSERAAMPETPAERPSKPSIRFIAFVMPAIQKTDSIIDITFSTGAYLPSITDMVIN